MATTETHPGVAEIEQQLKLWLNIGGGSTSDAASSVHAVKTPAKFHEENFVVSNVANNSPTPHHDGGVPQSDSVDDKVKKADQVGKPGQHQQVQKFPKAKRKSRKKRTSSKNNNDEDQAPTVRKEAPADRKREFQGLQLTCQDIETIEQIMLGKPDTVCQVPVDKTPKERDRRAKKGGATIKQSDVGACKQDANGCGVTPTAKATSELADRTRERFPECLPLAKNRLQKHQSTVLPNGQIPSNPKAAAKRKPNEHVLESFDLEVLDASPKTGIHPDILDILREQRILPLKKKSRRVPKANYFCHLCEYHCDGLSHCKKHILSLRHMNIKRTEELDMTLRQLPPANRDQAEVISGLLTRVYEEHRLSDDDILQREQIVQDLNELLAQRHFKDCKIQLYGSTLSRSGIRGCDVNIALQVTSEQENPALLLKKSVDVIRELPQTYVGVATDWQAKMPTVTFQHKETGFRFVMVLCNTTSHQTSKLIKLYLDMDPRARLLCTIFRYWARVCKVDRQLDGTLPSHAYDLMVIYFLQQLKNPILPVLHELKPFDKETQSITDPVAFEKLPKTQNAASIGAIWVEMFRYYSTVLPISGCAICIRESKPFLASKRNWRGRKLAIEDPYAPKRNLARCVSSPRVCDFIISCFKVSFKYFAIPQTSKGPLFDNIKRPEEMLLIDSPDDDVHFLEPTKNLLKELNMDMDIQMRQLETSNESEEEEGGEKKETKKKAVEEGRKRAISAASTDMDGEEGEPLDSTMTVGSEGSSSSDEDDSTSERASKGATAADKNERVEKDKGDNNNAASSSSTKQESLNSKTTSGKKRKKIRIDALPTPKCILELIAQVKKKEFVYSFSWEKLTGGQEPIIECSLCQKEGHLKRECPEDALPPLVPLPPPQPFFNRVLSLVCVDIENFYKPKPSELEERYFILKTLNKHIQNIYPKAELDLFGSSRNGFGFGGSDLDICLTFKDNNSGKNLNYVEIILKLAESLKKFKAVYQVIAIPTAKVPIVKFIHGRTKLECDISLYNLLAKQNTRMLNLYAAIDPRVRTLGYMMKFFAKMCDIGDASRGSLSSYAYTLMVIFFLQQRNPPVIPVLQELYDPSKPPPQRMVDGWNAWFCDDLQMLDRVWPHKGQNRESVGGLWIGLLRFYTEEFNFKENVISIRQLAVLTRFEKLWNTKSLAIEDPFDLSHNLGTGVSRKMHTYIMKAFIRGRQVFGTPLPKDICNKMFIKNNVLHPETFTDGPPPSDRCCHYCRRIGHVLRDCPRRENHREQAKKRATSGNNNNSRNNSENGKWSSTAAEQQVNDVKPVQSSDQRQQARGKLVQQQQQPPPPLAPGGLRAQGNPVLPMAAQSNRVGPNSTQPMVSQVYSVPGMLPFNLIQGHIHSKSDVVANKKLTTEEISGRRDVKPPGSTSLVFTKTATRTLRPPPGFAAILPPGPRPPTKGENFVSMVPPPPLPPSTLQLYADSFRFVGKPVERPPKRAFSPSGLQVPHHPNVVLMDQNARLMTTLPSSNPSDVGAAWSVPLVSGAGGGVGPPPMFAKPIQPVVSSPFLQQPPKLNSHHGFNFNANNVPNLIRAPASESPQTRPLPARGFIQPKGHSPLLPSDGIASFGFPPDAVAPRLAMPTEDDNYKRQQLQNIYNHPPPHQVGRETAVSECQSHGLSWSPLPLSATFVHSHKGDA